MATIYDEAGTVVATGVGVADASQLGQRRADVVHDQALGGLPYIVRKASAGYAGSLELLCSDVDAAWAIHQAHDAGLVRLDTYARQNLATYWRTPLVVDAGQPGTPSVVASGGPVGLGWWQFLSTGPDSGSPFSVSYSGIGTAALPVTAGETYTVSAYVRQDSADAGTPAMRIAGTHYDAAGVDIGSTANDTLSVVQGAFVRISRVVTPPAGAAFFRPVVSFSGSDNRPAGTVYYVVGVMLELGAAPGVYFNGSSAPPGYVSRWAGAADLSASSLSALPAFDMTYDAVNGVDVPHQLDEGIWTVRVPQVQEVAA